MYSGKQIRLKRTTLSIETVRDERLLVMVPTGSVVIVVGGPLPHDRRMVDVLWDGRALVMFAIDLQVRGRNSPERAPGRDRNARRNTYGSIGE